jgi:hypothetical protein
MLFMPPWLGRTLSLHLLSPTPSLLFFNLWNCIYGCPPCLDCHYMIIVFLHYRRRKKTKWTFKFLGVYHCTSSTHPWVKKIKNLVCVGTITKKKNLESHVTLEPIFQPISFCFAFESWVVKMHKRKSVACFTPIQFVAETTKILHSIGWSEPLSLPYF